MNIYKNCDECKYRKKSYNEKPCNNCLEKNIGGYKKKNWKAKNILIAILAWFEE